MAYNILLFGETDAGKSTTTINALANYLRHTSFDEAASAGELVNLVPSKFTYPETNESKIVDQNRIDSNPNKSNDNSVGTPKHYELEFEFDGNIRKQIRIIDTLGMGNLEIDKENFKIILEHLKGLETLNGICFLIDKNSVFKSNLNELLAQVPRSASKNILFCFNFSQSQHLDGAGSQFEVLKALLDENELGSSKIDLEIGENCFFIDNEAFGYLLAAKLPDNLALTEDQTVKYRENWNASRDQTLSMLQQIVGNNFEPIQLELLFKLINTQKWIQDLALPIDELKAKIHDQKESIKEDQRKMNSFNNKSKKRNSNAKQIKTTNDRIKAKRQVLREFEMELEMIEKFLCICLRFVVLNANFNCKDLILPYADLLAKDKSLDPTEQNQQPLVRRNSSRGSKRGRKRTNSTPKSPPNEPNNNKITSSNQVKVDDIKQLQTKLTQLKHSGKQLRDIFNVGLQTTKNPNISQNQKSENEQQQKAQPENRKDSPISTEKKEEIQIEQQNAESKEESKTADELQISNSDTPKLNDVENSEANVELEQNLFEQINELTLKNEQIEKSFEAALEMLESQQSELLQQNSSIHVENEEVEDEVVKEMVKEEVVKEEVKEVLKEEMKQVKDEDPQLNPIPVIQSPKLEQFISIEEADNQLPLNQNQEQNPNQISEPITTESIPEPVPVNPKQELNKNPQQFNNYSTFESKPPINEAASSSVETTSSDQIKSNFSDVLESVQSNLTEKVESKDDSKNSISNGIIEKSDDSVINPKENGSTKSQTEEPEISKSKIPEPSDNPELTSTSETTQTKDQEIKASPQESVAKSTPSSNAPSTTKNGKTNASNSRKQSSTKQKQSKSKNSKPKKSKGRNQSTERSSSGCDCPCSIM